MNEFWRVLKGLEGRTVVEVREVEVGDTDDELHTRVEVWCTDGYTVQLYVNQDDHDLGAEQVE